MPAQPEIIGALIPGVLPPQRGKVSEQAYRRGYFPKTYSQAEIDAAKRVIRHWNVQFTGVTGAYRANPGDACNTKAYVRMLRRCEKSEGLFQFSEQDARSAITAYRGDVSNNRLGRWKRFADWCVAENIDFYVGQNRVHQHRVEQPKLAQRQKRSITIAATRIVKHKELVNLAVLASKGHTPLHAALREMSNQSSRNECAREVLALFERRESLDFATKQALLGRARKVFDAYFHRPPGQDQYDAARIVGIELALLDRAGQDGRRASCE